MNNVDGRIAKGAKFFNGISKWNYCYKCPMATQHNVRPLIDVKNIDFNDVEVLFIGDAPSVECMSYKVPYSGPSGLFFRYALNEAGYCNTSFAMTNLVICRPAEGRRESSPNRLPNNAEIAACSSRIKFIIEALKPKKIVCLGGLAYTCVKEFDNLWNFDSEIVFLKHPAYILATGGSKSQFYQRWLSKLKQIKETPKSSCDSNYQSQP